MRVNFISSEDTGETSIIYLWRDNVNKWGNDTDDIFRKHFRTFLHNYEEGLKIISRSEFNFESVELMDYNFRRVRLRRDRSYIKSPRMVSK